MTLLFGGGSGGGGCGRSTQRRRSGCTGCSGSSTGQVSGVVHAQFGLQKFARSSVWQLIHENDIRRQPPLFSSKKDQKATQQTERKVWKVSETPNAAKLTSFRALPLPPLHQDTSSNRPFKQTNSSKMTQRKRKREGEAGERRVTYLVTAAPSAFGFFTTNISGRSAHL